MYVYNRVFFCASFCRGDLMWFKNNGETIDCFGAINGSKANTRVANSISRRFN